MPSKLCPKIILEGTRLTLKTDIAFALNEHPRIVGPRKYRYHSPIISAEWRAFTNFPWGRGLINFEPQEREERLKVSGNPSQYDNLQIFIDDQEMMRGLVEESLLPTLILDISDSDITKATDSIADWLEETGGLWAT